MKCKLCTVAAEFSLIILVSLTTVTSCTEDFSEESLQAFEQEIEQLRIEWKIPGMSVAILHKQEVVMASGYGYSDLENRIPATEETPYNLASCTKPIAAVLLLQLAEAGQLNLDAAMTDVLQNTPLPVRYKNSRIQGYEAFYRVLVEIMEDSSNPLVSEFRSVYGEYQLNTQVITVRHHLTHTAEGVPGEIFKYNGDLYSFLSLVVEELTGKRFDEALVERVIGPLGMTDTIPSVSPGVWGDVLERRSKYYRVGRDGKFIESRENRPIQWPSDLEKGSLDLDPSFLINAGAGMISTVVDLAKFDIALDRNKLLSPVYREMMFTAFTTSDGRRLPYGLGWFVQEIYGQPLIWHFGYAGIHSSLYLKVPQQETTLILLANSGGASEKFQLGEGNILRSPFASAFIKHLTTIEEPIL